jgi:GT2 family glycosyltransferase
MQKIEKRVSLERGVEESVAAESKSRLRSEPKVLILVLNWNNWPDTRACLISLQNLDYRNCELLVLDNGSTDDSVERLSQQFPAIEILELENNLGFSGGNNAGIRIALARQSVYVWLLNNDTIVDRMALQAMVKKAESDARIAAVGSAIYSASRPEQLQAWGGGYVDFWLGRSRHFRAPVADERLQFLTGASLLLRLSVIDILGSWDEDFFLYWEDADYCFRLRDAGWKLAVSEGSKVWHREQGTVGKNSRVLDTFFTSSATKFFAKHAPIPVFSIWIGAILRITKRVICLDWKRAHAIWTSALSEYRKL